MAIKIKALAAGRDRQHIGIAYSISDRYHNRITQGSHLRVFGIDVPGPSAGKWHPEPTFRIDLCVCGTSLGRPPRIDEGGNKGRQQRETSKGDNEGRQ